MSALFDLFERLTAIPPRTSSLALPVSPDFIIRAFTQADAPAVCSLHTRAIMHISETFYSKTLRESWAHGLTPQGYVDASNRDETYEVAVAGGKVIAFCGRTQETVKGLYVDPDWQGRGIGRELLARAETILRSEGSTMIVIESSLSAEAFYVSCGFRKVSEEKRTSRGGLLMGACMMRKELVDDKRG
jgi:ribosomal protein S18 acetylase RimI-like enzyme